MWNLLSLKCGSALDTMSSEPGVQPVCAQLAVGLAPALLSMFLYTAIFQKLVCTLTKELLVCT